MIEEHRRKMYFNFLNLSRLDSVKVMSFASWFAIAIGIAFAIGLFDSKSKKKKEGKRGHSTHRVM
ncbi:MAG TPA: hypothetical protein VEY70_21080 [Metabacillus sp.]|nr:hypothetical protein [Metabacillus sp.]